MAKLEGVKTLDMENGEITKVEYNGVVYERVGTDSPKVGDLGMIIDAWGTLCNGDFYKVTEIRNIGHETYHQFGGDGTGRVKDKDTMFFRKPSAPTLKVGDKVRLIAKRPKYGFGLARVGDVGEVRSINGDDVAVDFPNHTHWNGLISEIELAKDGKGKRTIAIAGDVVEMTTDDEANCYEKGDRFTTKHGKYGVYIVDNNGDSRYINDFDHLEYRIVEFVEEIDREFPEPTELFAKVNRPNNVPIPGDYVEFRDDIAEECSSFLTVGKKYEVERVDAFGGADITDDNDKYESAETDEIKAIYVKYTQEQADKEPKVGDKVLVVNPHRISTDYEEGDILTVRRLNPHKDVKDDGHFYSEEAIVHLNYDEVIVLNPEQVGEDKSEIDSEDLPVGTKVRGKVSGFVYTLYGRSPEYDGKYGKTYYTNENKVFCISEEQFEVISKPQEIEVGDLVRVVDSPGALPNGSVFKVLEVEEDGCIRGRMKRTYGTLYVYLPKHVELIAKAVDVYV